MEILLNYQQSTIDFIDIEGDIVGSVDFEPLESGRTTLNTSELKDCIGTVKSNKDYLISYVWYNDSKEDKFMSDVCNSLAEIVDLINEANTEIEAINA